MKFNETVKVKNTTKSRKLYPHMIDSVGSVIEIYTVGGTVDSALVAFKTDNGYFHQVTINGGDLETSTFTPKKKKPAKPRRRNGPAIEKKKIVKTEIEVRK